MSLHFAPAPTSSTTCFTNKKPPALVIIIVVVTISISLVVLRVGTSYVRNSVLTDSRCINPPIRSEWRSLSTQQRKEYIKAVNCLASKPSLLKWKSTATRFDDFVAVHSNATGVHFTGSFLPWHRWLIAVYESTLRQECGYTGTQPYWDWTLDTVDFLDSPLFDTETGFGGDGGGGCIKDGPFSQLIVSVGPGKYNNSAPLNPRCITRKFKAESFGFLNTSSETDLLEQPDFSMLSLVIQELPSRPEALHGAGHTAIGGTMVDVFCAPGDPLFYMHHTNLDRIYWEWQKRDLLVRLHQVGGPVIATDYTGVNVTLDFQVNLGPMGDPLPLEALLDIKGNILCYDYE